MFILSKRSIFLSAFATSGVCIFLFRVFAVCLEVMVPHAGIAAVAAAFVILGHFRRRGRIPTSRTCSGKALPTANWQGAQTHHECIAMPRQVRIVEEPYGIHQVMPSGGRGQTFWLCGVKGEGV